MAKNDIVYDPDVVLTQAEKSRIKSTLTRAAQGARQGLILTYLMQGMTPEQLADVSEKPLAVVLAEIEEITVRVQDQMESQPEGQLIVAQLTLDGYARYMLKVMKATDRCVALAETSNDPKAWTAASSMLRLTKETMDEHMSWMQKFGVLPNLSRPVGRPKKDITDPNAVFDEMAKRAGTTREAIENDLIASAAGKRPDKVEASDD